MTDKSLTFGRRAASTGNSANLGAAPPLPDVSSPPLSPAFLDRKLTTGQWAAIATVGVVVILIAGITALRAFGNAPRSDAGSYPLVETSLRHVGVPSPALKEAHETCASRSIGGRRRFDGYPPAAEGETLLLQHVHYLNCIAGERVERFCNAKDREHLRYAVANYFTLMDRVRAAWDKGPRTIRMTVSYSANPYAVPKRPSYPSDQTDPSVVTSLQRLIERGYITQSDLGGLGGWNMPGDLGEALRGVSPHEKSCA